LQAVQRTYGCATACNLALRGGRDRQKQQAVIAEFESDYFRDSHEAQFMLTMATDHSV
jgi:hypothetical protein